MNRKNLFNPLVFLVGLTILLSTFAFGAAGDITVTMSANALNVRANEVNLQILKLAVANASGGASTITSLTLTDVGTSDLATDITSIAFYNGDVSASRQMMAAPAVAFTNGGAQVYTFTQNNVFADAQTGYIYVVVNLNGVASVGETFQWNVTAGVATGTVTPAGASAAATVAAASSVPYWWRTIHRR